MLFFLHLVISLFLLLAAIYIFLTKNSVYSVLFLILCFILSAIILILFEKDFLALLFIMVYVGAVAVLFLFVIMMIDTKSIRKKLYLPNEAYISLIKITIFSFSIGFLTLFFFLLNTFQNYKIKNSLTSVENFIDLIYRLPKKQTNIDILGQVFYNDYGIAVLLAGFVLLIALVGSISLTFDLNSNYVDDTSKQSSRDSNVVKRFS